MASPPSVSPPPPTNSSLTSPPQLSSIAPLSSPPSPPQPTNSSQPPPTPSDPPSPAPPLPSDPPSPPPPLPSSPPPNNQPPPVNNSPPPPPQISPTPPNNSPPPELPNSPPPAPPSTPLPAQNTSQAPPQLLPPPNSMVSPLPSNSSPLPIPQISPPPPSAVPSRTTPPPQSLAPPVSLSTNDSTHSSLQNSQSSNGGGMGTGGAIAIAFVLGLVMLGILGAIACCLWKRKKKPTGRSGGLVSPGAAVLSSESDSDSRKVQILSSSYHRSNSNNGNAHAPRTPGSLRNLKSSFTYEELMEATDGFSTQNLLGEGGFGSVYRGNLEDGREVAVKKLKFDGGQGEREFRSEVEIISRVHHRHLVSLVGYCIYEEGRILIYDYVPNNNLYHHLHDEDRRALDWVTRVKIALGAARGIAYLHEDCHPRIIHRDIKSSNILVDNNFEARVSDFGLAKLAMDANTHVTTRVMGTFGYMAPEYASSGKLTEKSDVYSFGVVLLELITGQKPVDSSRPLGDESLVEWARPLLSHALETHEFKNLADPRLEGNYVEGEMFRMVEAAAACVRHSSAKRPKMGQLVRAFDSMSSGDLSNGMKVGESDVFNQAESAQVRMFQKMVFGNGDVSTDLYPLQHGFTTDDDETSPVNKIQ